MLKVSQKSTSWSCTCW